MYDLMKAKRKVILEQDIKA